ncbi:MAG: prepilin-type N-terminal cleavage/methylation domain-containing protein [Paucibacter sp.]|nr:prepilin-type N-terminal cleavage/methylation domain-containing protein [Roseateles sp.]
MKKARLPGPNTACELRIARYLAGGFTLIELMLVVIIVGVLAMVALPSYQKQVAKGRRADAVTALSGIVQAQERWRSNRDAYASSLETELKLSPNSEKSHYTLSLSGVREPASFNFGYIAKATPVSTGPQSGDSDCKSMSIRVDGGNIFYESIDSSNQDSSSLCWPR